MISKRFTESTLEFVKHLVAYKMRYVIALCTSIALVIGVVFAYNSPEFSTTPVKKGASSSADVSQTSTNQADSTNPRQSNSGITPTTATKSSSEGVPSPKQTAAQKVSTPGGTPASTPGSNPPSPSLGGFIANCITIPSSCGYPDATNTGVPPGTSLSNSGSITVTTNGAVIQNLNVNGQIVVRANNVTIKNTRITSGDYYPIDYDGFSGLVVQDTEIYGTNTDVTAGMSFSNYTARRVYIHGTVDGFKADENVLIEDSYVTALRYDAVRDTHNDGVQTTGGSGVTLRHNTFKLGGISGISSVIQIGTEWGSNNNWLVTGNLIDGGGWSVNAQAVSAGTNRVFSNNRFTRAHGYGVGDVPNSVWSGNYYDNNGEAINK